MVGRRLIRRAPSEPLELSGLVDIHAHLLPGIDDGPPTGDAAVEMARAAQLAGIEVAVATPHVDGKYGVTAGVIEQGLAALRSRLAAEGVALDVRQGAEIAIDRLAGIAAPDLGRLSLDGGRWLLIECPFTKAIGPLEHAVFQLRLDRWQVVLAHPERCPAFHAEPQRLEHLVDGGCRIQITAGALVGDFGRATKKYAMTLVRERPRDVVIASDAHDAVNRPPGLAAAVREVGVEAALPMVTSAPRSLLAAGG